MGLEAIYFDGRTSAVRSVQVSVAEGRVRVSGSDIDRDEPIRAVVIPDALGRTARPLHFTDGATCLVRDQAALAAQLAAAGDQPGFVTRWENSWSRVIVSLAVLAALLVGIYTVAAPLMAQQLADQLPPQVATALSRQVLDLFDRNLFEPTAVSEERQTALRVSFARLQWPARRPGMDVRLVFRRGEAVGPNAMALPNGWVVVTDELLELAEDDWEVLAVLAHEAGHVYHRHGLRQLLQSSAVGLLIAWYAGDVSVVVAMAPTALLQAKYSRDFEREADDFAAGALSLNGIPTERFAAMLERLEARRREPGTGGFSYLDSHPATAERIARLRGGQ